MQQTSIDAYKELTSLGLKQKIVYEAIKTLGTATDMDVTRYLSFSDPNRVRPRRNELVRKGLVISVGKTTDPHTRKTVLVWKVIA